jgi:hypothetical protein
MPPGLLIFHLIQHVEPLDPAVPKAASRMRRDGPTAACPAVFPGDLYITFFERNILLI